MAKMAFSPQERPRVKLECLRLLTTLIEGLGEALLDFNTEDDLQTWLNS